MADERLDSIIDLNKIADEYKVAINYIQGVVDNIAEANKKAKINVEVLKSANNLADMTKGVNGVVEANKAAAASIVDFRKSVAATANTLEGYTGSLAANLKQQYDYTTRLEAVKKELKELKSGTGDYQAQIIALTKEQQELKVALSETNIAIKQEIKENQAAADSIDAMSLRLGRLKDAYRQIGEVDRNSAEGLKLKKQIDELDVAVKNADASIGNFQRNVGNYPNAEKELKAINEQLIRMKLAGQEDTEEFKDLTSQANNLGIAINSVGKLTPLTSGSVVTTSQHLGQINAQMHQLAVEGKKDTDEFRNLVEEARRLQEAIDSVRSEVRGVGQAVQQAGEEAKGFREQVTDWAKGIVAAAAAFFTIQTVVDVVKDSYNEFAQADEAAGRLKNTLQGYDNVQAFGRFADQADEFAEKFKHLDNDDVEEVFNNLLTYGKLTEQQMNELLPVIVDFAAKEKVSVKESSETIIKALEGNGKALKVYGIDIKEAGDASEMAATPAERLSVIMKELKPRVEGAAQAFGQTLPGTIAILQQALKNLEEDFGRLLFELSGVEQQAQKNAIAAKKEATEAQSLVQEYEQLKSKVNATAADKQRLNDITTTLAANFGNSVIQIDAETGALTLNIEKTQELIKQKLLLSNQRASDLALKYDKAEKDRVKALDEAVLSQLAYRDAVKSTGETIEDIRKKQPLDGNGNPLSYGLTDSEKKLVKLSDRVKVQKELYGDAANKVNNYAKALEDLGFSIADVYKLFNPGKDQQIVPKTDRIARVRDDLKLQLSADKELIDAKFNLARQELDTDSQNQKAIMESTRYSLDARLDAYHKYYHDQETLADLTTQKDIATQEAVIKTAQDRLSAANNGKIKMAATEQAALKTQIEAAQINIQAITKKHDADMAGTERQAGKDMIDIVASNEATIIKLKETALKKQLVAMEGAQTNEEQQLLTSYKNGEISEVVYREKLKDIQNKYQLEQDKANLQFYWNLLNDTKLTTDEELKEWDAYFKALKKLNDDSAGQQAAAAAKKKQDRETLQQEELQATGLAVQAVAEAKNVLVQYYDKEIALLKEKADLIEQNKNDEIAAINASLASEETKKTRIAEITAQAAAQTKQIKDEEAAINRKKAIAERASALLNIAQQTAVAEVSALKLLTNPITAGLYPVIASLIAGIGLGQAAVIAGQEIPAYADGVQDHPGGDALVGEVRPETIIEPGKAPYNVYGPQVLNLPRHTRVLPRAIPEHELKASIAAAGMSPGLIHSIMVQQQLQQQAAVNDYSGLESVMKQELAATRDAIQNMPRDKWTIRNGELQRVAIKGTSTTTFINKNLG